MLSRFFVDRPIFAWVLSIVIVLAGIVAYGALPIAQYPPVVPPTISVTTSYPGASAVVLADTVGQPIEEQIVGTEGLIYMSSTCTNNGQYTLTVSFDVGTDIHTALMLVQTRVQLAQPQLPSIVQKQGVNVQMKSPNILLAINLYSPNGTRDPLYMSNYAEINLFDKISNLPGVGLVSYLGQRQYSMRAWLDPQKLASLDLTASDVVQAISEQNVEVAAGNLGQQPVPKGQQYQLVLNALGRLTTPEQFGNIVVKVGEGGRFVRLREVAEISLGAENSDLDCTLTYYEKGQVKRYPSIGLAVYALPQANALDVGERVKKEMDRLSKRFPEGMSYTIAYDTTPFIQHSVDDVIHTIIIAAILVIIVVMVFIQDWHAMLLPMIDIVVSLIGTFVIMKMLGFSLNNLSLFGLVLAVGIVVDDSIVVVENIERWMAMGLPAKEATVKAMDEITGPVVGITLVLCSVFVPTAFIPGLTGQFFQQFALTIAVSTVISASNALTMAPARAASWIKPHKHGEVREPLPRIAYALLFGYLAYLGLALFVHFLGMHSRFRFDGLFEWISSLPQWLGVRWRLPDWLIRWTIRGVVVLAGAGIGWIVGPLCNKGLTWFFNLFNRFFEAFASGYTRIVGWLLRLSFIVIVVYVGLLVLTGVGFATSPTGFVPEQDQGYLLVNVELPDSASVQRTTAELDKLAAIAVKTPGVKQVMAVGGFSAFFQCDSSNWGTMFVILDDFDQRTTPQTQAAAIAQHLNRAFHEQVISCKAVAFGAPPVPGLGQGGGFQLQIEDQTGLGLHALQDATETIVQKANAQPGLMNVFTTFKANTPQLYLDIDREKAKQMGVSLDDVFQTLNINIGSIYVNQFNEFGRIWQVNVQAQGRFRTDIGDLSLLKVRNKQGDPVPLSSLVKVRYADGPVFVMRYNDLNSSAVNGASRPGFSSGQALSVMEDLCQQNLPEGMSYEWTNLSYQEWKAEQQTVLGVPFVVALFAFAVAMVFLVLAALYESWGLPLAIILVVPMCLLASIAGLVWIMHMPVDIFSQIGFVVLVALAAKNAILIVEYAKEKRKEGMETREATLLACKLRLRPILMTSFAFIFGTWPLVIATGAGWEMRHSLGTAVVSGMIGVTLFGVFLTPVFYYVVTRFSGGGEVEKPAAPPPVSPPPATDGKRAGGDPGETAIQAGPSSMAK